MTTGPAGEGDAGVQGHADQQRHLPPQHRRFDPALGVEIAWPKSEPSSRHRQRRQKSCADPATGHFSVCAGMSEVLC
eukprot:554835-Rhodomonas_salina.3